MSDSIDGIIDAAVFGKPIIRNREMLHFSYIPDTIQHRDVELKQVTQSLVPILKHSRPSNLLIYGKAGTGKTLIVRKILSKIQERVKQSNFPIKLAYTNSKIETAISGLLVSFARQIGLDKKEIPSTGLAIADIFNRILKKIGDEGLNVIFVIDEIDNLTLYQKSKNDILYNLTRANSMLDNGSLTLVGISNDLRFKERLEPRVTSGLGEEEIVFTNYSVDQIKKILKERIDEAFIKDAVEEPALNLCAAMAGSEHGDARRAIDLIRIAGELAERQRFNTVTEDHVREAAKKTDENKIELSLRSYPLHEKLTILAIVKANGASTGEIYSSYKNLCKAIGRDTLTQRRITQILGNIELSGIINGQIIHHGIHGRNKKYKLTIQSSMVKKAFKDDLTLQGII